MPHKLLLADDSVTIQRVIELTFADEDVQVRAVGDGNKAIASIQSERPDIVLADVGMPERDGYDVAAFIKGNPQLAGIPVLLLTGAFEPIDETRARAVGCDGVLVKPFEPQMVINRVKDLLAGRRSGGLWGAKAPSPESPRDVPRAMAPVETAGSEQPAQPAAGGAASASLEEYSIVSTRPLPAWKPRLRRAPCHMRRARLRRRSPPRLPHRCRRSRRPPHQQDCRPRSSRMGPGPYGRSATDRRRAAAPAEPPPVEPSPVQPSPTIPLSTFSTLPRAAAGSRRRLPRRRRRCRTGRGQRNPLRLHFRRSLLLLQRRRSRLLCASPPPRPVFETPIAVRTPAPVIDRAAPISTPAPAPAATLAGAAVPSLAEAFAALLSAEQGRRVAASTVGSPAVSEDTVEEIVRQVLARMTDQVVRDTVIDVAERLVRQEIERIKSA